MNSDEYARIMQDQELAGNTTDNALKSAQSQFYLQESEKGLAESQLDVETIISKIYHLLKQDVLKELPDGTFAWVEVSDKNQRTLSDWGVDRFMRTITTIVNKNTLLTNYSEQQINIIMLKLIRELNGLVMQLYEKIFRKATIDECKAILMKRMEDKKSIRKLAYEITGRPVDEEKIEAALIKETEQDIEKELLKIREEERKSKIREYSAILAEIEFLILPTLNRALKGEERGSLRRHTNISEVFGKSAPPEKPGRFTWFGR